MSYHKNTRKEDLIDVLKEIGEQATSKETIIQLKTKLEKSAALKDDNDFVMNLLNLSVEGSQTKAEQQLQVINSQLEHFAVTKTEELVRKDYCFPNMRKCVVNVVKNCVECKLANKRRLGEPTTGNRKKSSISVRRVSSNQGAGNETTIELTKERGFSERTLDAEVDDLG
ncbi:hypothetical protein TNCV_2776651 [Trichonephila clavipes]|nr:hypothetical protein TNCV_2776651 [Trichonephila clavipes]